MTDGAATKELSSVGTGMGAAEGRATPSAAQRPVLTVIRGEPTPEQLAALLAVVVARGSSGGAAAEPQARSLWATPVLRGALAHGPGAWRASALPR